MGLLIKGDTMKQLTVKEQIDKLSKNTCGYLACDNFDKKECKSCQKCFYDLEQQLLASRQENKGLRRTLEKVFEVIADNSITNTQKLWRIGDIEKEVYQALSQKEER